MTVGHATATAFDPERWHDFAVAVAGASAALAGLLVVAVSINLQPIIADEGTPRRAVDALVTLITPLIFCVVLLVPDISSVALGWSLVVIGVVCGTVLAVATAPSHRPRGRSLVTWLIAPVMPAALLALTIVLAGVGVLLGTLGGLFWLPVAVIASVLGGLFQAWVLLVEILR